MAMEIWRPMREMRRLTEEMDRMMEDAFGPFGRRFYESSPMRMFDVPVNVYQKDNELHIEASLPDIRPEDVDVSITGRTLTVKVERKETKEIKEEDYLRREWMTGRMFRQVTLPAEVDADKAEATYENGVLHLRLPLSTKAGESHIKVKSLEGTGTTQQMGTGKQQQKKS
jgi:HSP20 family protein